MASRDGKGTRAALDGAPREQRGAMRGKKVLQGRLREHREASREHEGAPEGAKGRSTKEPRLAAS